MDFYLVRHGEALADTADARRPLSEVGRREVERVARAAAQRNVQVAEILHSGILRADQTAEILARHIGAGAKPRAHGGLKPGDDPFLAKAELETADRSLMLVGHLPHMSRLAALLVTGDPERDVVPFAPATLVCCVREGSGWSIGWTLAPRPASGAVDRRSRMF